MFFGKKKAVIIDNVNIAYKQNLGETNCLFIYNIGTHTLKAVIITLVNKEKETFDYLLNPISPRSNEVVDFGNSNDSNGKLFSGNLVKVIVKTNELSFAFKPNEKNTFDKLS